MTIFWNIAEIVISAILGGGAVWLINWKAAKKKPVLENESLAANTQHEVVSSANETTQIALEENRALVDSNKDLTERNRVLRDQLDDIRSERVAGLTMLCRNITCPFRDPMWGSAEGWFARYRSGEDGCKLDDRPIEDIAADKGYLVERNK